jgi:predicted RNA-binding protein YlqC (UPF0109 family)
MEDLSRTQTLNQKLVEEREALQIIMEQKIEPLVTNISQMVTELGRTLSKSDTLESVTLHVQALRRLVYASAVAMKETSKDGHD